MEQEERRGKDLSRTLRLLAGLMGGERHSAATAAERYGFKRNSIQRNLRLLEECIPAVRIDKDGRTNFYLYDHTAARSSRRPSEQPFQFLEIVALSLAVGFAKVFSGSRYRSDLVSLRNKLIDRLSPKRKARMTDLSRKFAVLGGEEELLEDQSTTLDTLIDALLANEIIRIDYQKFEGEERVGVEVEPLSLLVYDAHLYLIAIKRSDRASGPRAYRFSRIRSVESCEEIFPYPSANEYHPESVFKDSFGIFVGDLEPCRVVVRLSKEWAIFAHHHRWHSSQDTKTLEDGSVRLEFWVRPCPEFQRWVLGFGEQAEVLEPESLRASVTRRISISRANYA